MRGCGFDSWLDNEDPTCYVAWPKYIYFFVTKKMKKPTEMWEEKHQNYYVVFCLFFFFLRKTQTY